MAEKMQLSQRKEEANKKNQTQDLNKSRVSGQNCSHFDRVLHLQRTIGNRAVTGLIKSGVLQASLKIGQPGDIYEKEADRIADQVMRMPESAFQRTAGCSDINCMGNEQEGKNIQTTPANNQTPVVTPNIDAGVNSLKGGGQPLPISVRNFFEPRFGMDFSQVRIHTDENAAESAKMLNARAYTIERDVAFGAGQFQPEAPSGKQLLAHELTHVVQPHGTLGNIQRACGMQAIGSPEGCTPSNPIFVPGAFFRFETGCDDFASGQDQALLQYAATIAPTDVIEIHGYASVDGSFVFNRNLACARALRARELLATTGRIQRTRIVGIFNHGPTPGPAADRHSVVIRPTAHTGPTPLGFIVHRLTPTPGRLDDPDQTMHPGNVSWPLSFAVPSPMEAEAEVEVVGSGGDPCSRYQIGFLQTVYNQWLNINYLGQQPTDGSTIVSYTVTLPIRDGDPSSMWYVNSVPGRVSPTACNVRVNPNPLMGDYPTIFLLPKVHQNTVSHHTNYIRSVIRGMYFVTTLVASGPGGVIPLRHFRWDYLMSINFTPNYTAVNQTWPFQWNQNIAHPGTVQNGADNVIPIFTTPTPTYNQSLTPQTVEF